MSWTEETFERLQERDARGARVADARQPLDDPQRHQPARGPGRDDARADGGQPRGRARARGGWPSRPQSLSEELLDLRRAGAAAEPDAYGRTLAAGARAAGRLRAQPAAGVVRAGRVRADRPGVRELRARRALGRRVDPRRPVPGADGAGQQGARRGRRRDEGRRHRVRGADGAARGGHLPEAAGGAARAGAAALPRDPPVGARDRPLAEVGRARHVRVGPHASPSSSRTTASRARRGWCCAT